MGNYEKEIIEFFLENQEQLFGERVAETEEEAEEVLYECMAQVLDSLSDVRKFLDESGMDHMGMSDEELLEQSEVFALPDGRYLVVEG